MIETNEPHIEDAAAREKREKRERREASRKAHEAAVKKATHKRGNSRAETAVLLGVSLPTVDRRIADGTIPSTKIGKRRIVSDDTINAILKSEAV